jgi:hypothetical protein
MRKLILIPVLIFLASSCLVENIYENSFLLDSITRVELSSNDTVFVQREETFTVKYTLKYFSEIGEVDLGNSVNPKLFLNEANITMPIIDLSQQQQYVLQARFPNKANISSNPVSIRVLSLADAITSINLTYQGASSVLIPALETRSFDDLFRIELVLVTGERKIVNSSFFNFLYFANDTPLERFDLQNLPLGNPVEIQVGYNGILSNQVTIEPLSIVQAVTTIRIALVGEPLINKSQVTGNLSGLLTIQAGLRNLTEINLKNHPDTYTLQLNGVDVADTPINSIADGVYRIRVKVGTLVSNNFEVEFFDPSSVVQRIELRLNEFTNNTFAVAGVSKKSFDVKVFGADDRELNFTPTLKIDHVPQEGFKDVLINAAGTIQVFAELFGKRSNVISITSRPNDAFPVIRVPVVFHVLDNTTATINRAVIDQEIRKLNDIFSNQFSNNLAKSSNAVASFFQFFLVDRAPSGALMAEVGINRMAANGQQFNTGTNQEFNFLLQRLWDPRRYLNIFIAPLPGLGGYAYYPVLNGANLPGMSSVPNTYTLNYPYATVMNEQVMGRALDTTLAHEIGHMLALIHTFESSTPSNCFDADFCPDTEQHPQHAFQFLNPNNLVTNCQGQVFYSTNIMDYVVRANSFTLDQRSRMRVVAQHAPFFAKEANYLGGRLEPLIIGKPDYSIKPVQCISQKVFGKRYLEMIHAKN